LQNARPRRDGDGGRKSEINGNTNGSNGVLVMALTDQNLVLERGHLDGVQRIYRFPGGFGLSLVNAPMVHAYPFAWEAAVLTGVKENGDFEALTYDTPLTNDVEVFGTEEEANEFIERAAKMLEVSQ
jgi:hypothetical protein